MGAQYFFMDIQNFNTPAVLTQEQSAVLENLMKNPDPTSRLRSDYYHLRHREILSNYAIDIATTGIDYKDRVEIQTRLFEALKELRNEYDADINHAIALHLSTLNTWVPWCRQEDNA